MSALTSTQELSTINVSPKQSEEATEVSRRFSEVNAKDLRIRIESASGETVVLPENLNDLLQTVLRLAASGREIGLAHRSKALTSVEAAQMLGISRPTLIKMAAAGEIPSHKVGSHNRFLRTDLEEFAERRADAERAAFNAFRDLEHEIDQG
ncbi:excisionase family DNA binding protein [Arthrobacter pigmenti]|uniref:Excisionase family DNA binding protein n=1 Tax=Arthrobacter pigmenti TaxID=271432 RepID=A0A846RWL2_9MICC|nr:helix-turn-helix domain-containing protein [Arthrobacter pigmenti]NJC23985.1 excisionase family DNA binding protein [Arthrobacter pigmenti]